jgi:transcription initiation factor TFIIIB Brf1 subunit/transcription initiation factor TFIIB
LVGEYLEHLEEVARGVGKVLSDVRDVRGVAQILAWGRRLGLPDAVVKEAVSTFLSHGFRSDEAAAASIYLACVKHGHHITPTRISLITGIRASSYKWILTRIAGREGIELRHPRKTPEDEARKIVKALNLGEDVERHALNMIAELRQRTTALTGKHAETVAAGAVYIAAEQHGHNTMKKEVAEAAGITTPTLNNAIKFIAEKLDIETYKPKRKRRK